MAAWTLPAVEAHPDSDLFGAWLTPLRTKCNNLMTFLRQERILLLNADLQFFCLELELLAEDQTRVFVEDFREVYIVLDDC